jgi:CheY-like chemotaxis protein
VETVVIEAVGLLRASLPAGIELVKTLDPNAPNIFADATQIHQVLLNLCTNAWHAIGDGPGRIEIQVQAVEIRESEATNTSDLRPGRYVRLSVIDTGQGMDSATVERIFEPFFTTKELGRGTGLGLSVVLGIVQSHDGVIRVSSQLGMGTAFHLYFPTVAADTSEALPAVRTVQPGVGQRILYLDDEKPLVDASVQMLRRLSYTADGCTDPREALEILRKNPSRYHLIITDLHMPEVSGIEFIQSVRSFLPSLPIVLSSGHLTEEVAARARKLGVTKLLHKPNTLEDFGVSIHELLSVRES